MPTLLTKAFIRLTDIGNGIRLYSIYSFWALWSIFILLPIARARSILLILFWNYLKTLFLWDLFLSGDRLIRSPPRLDIPKVVGIEEFSESRLTEFEDSIYLSISDLTLFYVRMAWTTNASASSPTYPSSTGRDPLPTPRVNEFNIKRLISLYFPKMPLDSRQLVSQGSTEKADRGLFSQFGVFLASFFAPGLPWIGFFPGNVEHRIQCQILPLILIFLFLSHYKSRVTHDIFATVLPLHIMMHSVYSRKLRR